MSLPKSINYPAAEDNILFYKHLINSCLKHLMRGFVPLVKKLACDWLESGSCPVGMAAAEQTRPCCLHSGQLFIACLCLHVSVSVPPSPFTRARVNMPVQIAISQRQWQACTPSRSAPSSLETPTHPPRFRPRSLSEWESVQTLATFKLMPKNSRQTLWFSIAHK